MIFRCGKGINIVFLFENGCHNSRQLVKIEGKPLVHEAESNRRVFSFVHKSMYIFLYDKA